MKSTSSPMAKRWEDEVRTAYYRASEGTGSRDELVAVIRARVRDLKKQGQPPEKVIISIKRLCGLPLKAFAADTDASTDGSTSRQIAELVVRAAIDEYYAGRRAPLNGEAAIRTALAERVLETQVKKKHTITPAWTDADRDGESRHDL